MLEMYHSMKPPTHPQIEYSTAQKKKGEWFAEESGPIEF